MVKHNKAKLLNSQIEDLVQNKDNHKFWTYLKSLKPKEPSPSSKHDIPVYSLFRHFKHLHSNPILLSLPTDLTSTKDDITKLEETKAFHNSLDSLITLSEIETGVKTLKSKKAPGPDKIRNEMLKAGLHFLIAALQKLFNIILQSGFFPTSWCEGIITPIYKSGNKEDPAGNLYKQLSRKTFYLHPQQ